MNSLSAIVYVSTASKLMLAPELEALLAESRARNTLEHITGILLYCDGNFMQYIEGPTESLLKVYAMILGDQRHFGIIELTRRPVSTREFAAWDMAYAPTHKPHFNVLAAADWSLVARGNEDPTSGRRLLADFWHNQMGNRHSPA